MITPDIKPLMDATISILNSQGTMIPVVQLMPTFRELFPDDDSENFEYLPDPRSNGPDDSVCIFHSSGMQRHLWLWSVFTTIMAVLRLDFVSKAGHLYKS